MVPTRQFLYEDVAQTVTGMIHDGTLRTGAKAPSSGNAPRWRSTTAAARKVQIGAHMNEVLASARVPGVLNLGMLALEMDTDPVDGLRPEALAAVVERERIAAVVSVGTFNNPTGSVVPRAARKQIVSLPAKQGIPLIEDDIYGELYLGQHKPLPYKAFDRTGQVMTCSGFPKTIAPGYRASWVIADNHMAIERLGELARNQRIPRNPIQ